MNIKKRLIILVPVITGLIVLAWYLLFSPGKEIQWTRENALHPADAPTLMDDLDQESLIASIDNSLRYFDKKDPQSAVAFGKEWVPVKRVKESLLDFKDKLMQFGLTEEFYHYIHQHYEFFQSSAENVLITGYYEADLNGSLTRSETFRYPLYRKPDDLLRIDLSKFYFYKRYKNLPGTLRGRLREDNTIVPYYSREDIRNKQPLADKGLEIVWVDNAVDLFFLHIQGSGIVKLDTGETLRVNYAEANGHPYRAVGKLLLDMEVITYENMSMQSIRKYLEENPEKLDEVFNYNPSYVFFRVVEEGPIGSIGVPLTRLRSIASDWRLMPKGALCFVETEIPQFGSDDQVKNWKPFHAFVLNQDTGGAIRSPSRIDLFTGYGKLSRLSAGHMKQPGMFWFLLKKTMSSKE